MLVSLFHCRKTISILAGVMDLKKHIAERDRVLKKEESIRGFISGHLARYLLIRL